MFSCPLLTSQLHSLLQRPCSPCKNKSLALMGSSHLLDLGASSWYSLTLEEGDYFVMPERNEGCLSTLGLRKLNFSSCKTKLSTVVLTEISLQMVSVLQQSLPDSCHAKYIFSHHKRVKHIGHISVLEGLGSLPRQGYSTLSSHHSPGTSTKLQAARAANVRCNGAVLSMPY